MTNEIVLNGKAIALMSVGINNQLTSRQKTLLKLLHKCLKENKPLNWDLMIQFYVKNVNKYHKDWNYNYQKKYHEYSLTSILKSYKDDGSSWKYTIRPKVRNWFSTNMGSMILKGSILALPVIEIN